MDDIALGTVIAPTLVRNAWLSPRGILHHVDDYQHVDTAAILGIDMGWKIADGWLHVSCNGGLYILDSQCHVPHPDELTQAQRDTLFDMLIDGERNAFLPWQRKAVDMLRLLTGVI